MITSFLLIVNFKSLINAVLVVLESINTLIGEYLRFGNYYGIPKKFSYVPWLRYTLPRIYFKASLLFLVPYFSSFFL